MPIPTLNELHLMHGTIKSLEREAETATSVAAQLRTCGGRANLLEWWLYRRQGYDARDYNGITALLTDAMQNEFGPAILEILAKRQELTAHNAMTQAVVKRAELGSYVTLETEP